MSGSLQHGRNIAYRDAVLAAMDAAQIDAIIAPTSSNPLRQVGDRESPASDINQILSPQTDFSTITVPTGFSCATLSVGITIVG